MNSILSRTLTIISGPTLSGKTTKILELLRKGIQQQLSILFISLELSKQEITEKISLREKVTISHDIYIEDIYIKTKTLKSEKDIKLILIDGLPYLQTNQKHYLGQADIRFEILKQLKQLALELDVDVIATGPDNINSEIKNINQLEFKIVKLNSL